MQRTITVMIQTEHASGTDHVSETTTTRVPITYAYTNRHTHTHTHTHTIELPRDELNVLARLISAGTL